MGWWDTLKSKFGPGSRLDRVRKALPSISEVRQRLDAWRTTVTIAGNRLERWEADESKLLNFAKDCADMLDVAGKLVPIPGVEKMLILTTAIRSSVVAIDWADDKFDAWWGDARPLIEDYLARRPKPVS